MQAVIVAAGIGERLRPLTETTPKGLIPIDNKPLLEYSLEALKENGIQDAVIVIGFLGDMIRKRLGGEYKGVEISYALNPRFSNTGSMYSLSQAKDLITSDSILLLESDLLFDPEALGIVVHASYRDLILVADPSGSGDEVYVCVSSDNRITALGKHLPKANRDAALGELVGISRFSSGFLEKLFAKAEEDYASGRMDLHYEECIFETSQRNHPVYGVLCPKLTWIEIDTLSDLERARNQILPMVIGDENER